MEAEFWQDKWDRDWTPFHRSTTNPILEEFLPQLNPSQEQNIFVPLCGKTLDMLYLRNHYKQVIGVELVEKAVVAFFVENQLEFQKQEFETMNVFKSSGITIYQGDFFDFASYNKEPIHAVYDRAALVALPAEMRIRYAEYLEDLLMADSKVLLQAIEYNQEEMLGPPFSVSSEEVRGLYAKNFKVENLWSSQTLEKNPHLAKKGLTSLEESVYLLRK